MMHYCPVSERLQRQALTTRTNVALNKNSYAYLIPTTIGLLLLIALILVWTFIIWPSAHFNPIAEKIALISSPALAIILMVWGWHTRNSRFLRKKPLDRLKVFFGLLIASGLVMDALLSVVILLTSTVFSSYVTSYEYAAGGRHNCAGIRVFDTEVNKQIKICRTSYYGEQGWVRVEKRSGPLGIVVIDTTRL